MRKCPPPVADTVFHPMPLHVEFVVDHVSLAEVYVRVFRFALLASLHQSFILIHSSVTHAV